MTNNSRQYLHHLLLMAVLVVSAVGQSPLPQTAPAATATEETSQTSATEMQQPAVLQIAHQGPLDYPPIARALRIQGKVIISFKIDKDGAPQSPEIVSGQRLLAGVAFKYLKTVRFTPPPQGFSQRQIYVATFVFTISDDPEQPSHSPSEVRLSSTGLEFDVWVYDGPTVEACPNRIPSPVIQTPQDLVELSHSGCYGSCPIYTVDIFANGEVYWKGVSYVHAVGERRSQIPPQEARALIERFRTTEFWSLCESYKIGWTDLDTALIKLQFGTDSKAVSDYGDAAPSWVRDLEDAIGKTAHTEHWIGKPKGLRVQ